MAQPPNKTLDRVLMAFVGLIVLVIGLKLGSGWIFERMQIDDCQEQGDTWEAGPRRCGV